MAQLTRDQYIEKIWKAAVEACRGKGLFPSVMIAQGILESGNGNSGLAKSYNNHFGIKAGVDWTGKVANLNTKEVIDGDVVPEHAFFRVYDSIEAGFKDRNAFLKKNPRYTKAGVFSAKTPDEQIYSLAKAGYATDPDYARKLKSIIRANNLTRFDP